MSAPELPAVDVRQLAALVAIARAGSFTRAALDLGYTQSAVSQQLMALERAVGHRLVDRPGGRRAVSLTPAGEVLLAHAEGVLARLRTATAELGALTDGFSGTLRIGTYQSVAARILPVVLRRFSELRPRVTVELREADCDHELQRFVERGDLDLTFVALPGVNDTLETVQLLEDRYVVVVRPDDPVAAAERVEAEDLVGRRLLGFRSCTNEARVEARLARLGVSPGVVYRSDDNATLQGLAGAGVGTALMPGLTVDARDPETVVVDAGHLVPPRRIGLAWDGRRSLPAPAATFVELAREVCARATASRAARGAARGATAGAAG